MSRAALSSLCQVCLLHSYRSAFHVYVTNMITLSINSYRDNNNWKPPEPQSGQHNNDHLQCSTTNRQYHHMAGTEWLSIEQLRCSDTAVSRLHHQWKCVHMFSELITTVHLWRKEHHCHCSKLVMITQINNYSKFITSTLENSLC